MHFRKSFFILLLIWSTSLSAQHQELKYGSPNNGDLPEWAETMYGENPDIGLVKELYETYYLTHDFVKNQHTQYYKHWIRNISRDHNGLFYNNGSIDRQSVLQNERDYLERKKTMEALRGPNSAWSCIGPIDYDHDAAGRSYAPGSAHVYTIEQAATNNNTLWCGTATAGIYKSLDYGANWTLTTRDLMIGGSRAIEIDHSNANIVYFGASGQVYKTVDGGTNWATTGDAAFQSNSHSINDIVSDPSNANIIFLCADDGLYRSTNGGSTYTLLQSETWQELEFHTTNNSIVYAVKHSGDLTQFYKSTDAGLTWIQKPNGWPVPASGDHQRRTEIAVTPANPNLVVAQCTGAANGGSGLYGVYVSTDAGENWTFQCCGTQPAGVPSSTNKNMMGYSQSGTSDGGQYYYDVSLDISNTDADKMSLCGIIHWMTADGGTNWSAAAGWSSPGNNAYVHADIHDVRYFANDDIWIANDGGIYYSTDGGATFNRRTYGIAGTDFWGFGAGFQDGELMVGGTYHNSTLLKDGDTYINGWISTAIGGAGGDNVRGFTNFGKDDILYMDAGRRQVPHDRNTGFSDASLGLQTNASYVVGESSDMAFDPRNYNVIFIGNDTKLYRSEDEGSNYNELYDFGEKVTSIAIAWDNPDIMYVCTWPDWWGEKKIFRSADGGTSFTELTKPSFNHGIWPPLDVTVSSSNPDEIWLARCPQSGGYNSLDGEKVYHSTDGGQSWTNWSSAILNGEHLTNIIHQRGTDGGVYIGTRRGVYYRNNTMADWALFTNNLPARTFSTRLIPFYRGNKLRNGTDRSVWEVELYENSTPDAQIAIDRFDSYCDRQEVQFMDHSAALDNATYAWSFPGGTPATSSLRNPLVRFSGEGNYSVTLTVTDANGSDTQTLTDLITVHPSDCSPENVPDVALDASSSGYVNLGRPESLNFNGNDEFTFTAWIKPSVSNMHGYILTKYDRFIAGQYYFSIENGKIKAAREVSPWNVSGATDLTPGKWYHVAATYDGATLRVYVDGKLDGELAMGGSIGSIGKDILIGARHESGVVDDFFQGLLDEVSIWKRALSQAELRESRHLTLDKVSDTDLVGYYQFNETGTTVYDRGGFNNGTMSGGAVRSTSTAPVGGGFSHRMSVTSGGVKAFTDTGLAIEFPASGTYPNGEMVATRINLNPDQLPNANTPSSAYWVVNNYGSNPLFSTLEQISFDDIGTIGAGQDPSEFYLYKRNSNDDGNTWGTLIDYADAFTTGANGSVTFSTDNNINSFSQFIVMDETAVLPIEWLYFRATLTNDKKAQLDWASATEENSDYFNIERSSDGRDFETIGTMAAKGFSLETVTYRTYDAAPLRGTSYYRLKQFDKDGSFEYSEIRSITLGALPNHVAVFPNPVEKGNSLQIVSDLNVDLLVQVYGTNGRLIRQETVVGGLGEVSMKELSAGAYFYKVIGGGQLKMGTVLVR